MTYGIAHEVHERIHHPLDQKLVDLRFTAAELHDDLLPTLAREVSNHERHAFKAFTNLDHAHTHDALAQVSKLPRHAQTCFLKRTPARGWRHSFQVFQLLLEACSTDHELADDAHQFVESIEIDAHDARRRNRRN